MWCENVILNEIQHKKGLCSNEIEFVSAEWENILKKYFVLSVNLQVHVHLLYLLMNDLLNLAIDLWLKDGIDHFFFYTTYLNE